MYDGHQGCVDLRGLVGGPEEVRDPGEVGVDVGRNLDAKQVAHEAKEVDNPAGWCLELSN
jgi:hypothetical protein